MALRGDVAHIPISNILQALLLNGQEGVLKMEGSTFRRRVRVLKNGLRPLNYFKETPDLLKEILLKQRVLTEGQFQNILSTWEPGTMTAGDFLLTRRIVTQELVLTEIRRQVENMLYEILLTQDLKYEFAAEEDSSAFELFAPDGLGADLVFNVNSVLMEAMRRDDDWRRFIADIPSSAEVFVPTNKTALNAKDLDAPLKFLKELRPLLNGENTVNQLVAQTTLSAFEVYQTLWQLKGRGLLNPLPLEAKKALGDKLRRSLRAADAAEIYRSILQSDPDDEATRAKLIAILEKSKGTKQELIDNYLHVARAKMATDPEQCKAQLQKVIDVSPQEVRALGMLFDLHQGAGNHKDAMAVAKSVLDAARSGSDKQAAIDLLYNIVNYYPQESLLFYELANVHLDSNDVESAVACLKTVAQIYEARRDFPRLRKTWERIAQIKPAESYRLKRVIEMERRAQLSGKWLMKLAAITSVAAIACLLLGTVCVKEYYSRIAYAAVENEVKIHLDLGQPMRARQALEHFTKAFPYSMRMQAVQARLTDVDMEVIKSREHAVFTTEARRRTAKDELARAQFAYAENEYEKASGILAKLDYAALEPEISKKAKTLQFNIRKYFEDSMSLAAQADLAEKNQDMAAAHRVRCELLARFPYAPESREVLIPIEFRTVPPGAEVVVDGKALGRTPIVVKLPPRRVPPVTLRKAGFAIHNVNAPPAEGASLNPCASHVVEVQLSKVVEWKIDAQGSVEGFPCVAGQRVCFGTRNGDVIALGQSDGALQWKFTVPGNMDIAGGLGLWNNLIYFGSFDGRVYVLDGQIGNPTLQPIAATQGLFPIKKALSQPSERGTVVANADAQVLVGISLTDGQVVWSFPAQGRDLLGQPQAFQGRVCIPTSSGELLVLDHETGAIQRRVQVAQSLTSPGRIHGGTCYIGAPAGTLKAIDLKTGETVWSLETDKHLIGPPTVEADAVIVPTSTQELLCYSTQGELRWKSSLGDSISGETDGVFFRGNFYVGTRGGRIHCVDVWSGRILWSFDTIGASEKQQRGVLSRGALGEGKLYLGSEDHWIYCFTTD